TEKDEDVTCDVKLHPAQYLTGQVLTPDGKPAGKAFLVLAADHYPILLKNRRVNDLLGWHRQIRADDQGRYRFAMPAQSTGLLVLHDKGWATLPVRNLAQAKDVALQPWGAVEGSLRIGSRPSGNQTVTLLARLDEREGPTVVHLLDAKTDAHGRFAMDHVLPALGVIGYTIGQTSATPPVLAMTSPRGDFTRSRCTETEPGKTTTVHLGGNGTTVVGTVKLPRGTPGGLKVDWPAMINHVATNQTPPPMPPSVRSKPWKQRQDWLDQWGRTPEGRAERQRFLSIAAPVAPNGTFRVEDVPPGSYVLTLGACRRTPGALLNLSGPDVVGSLRHEFVVPKPTDKDADKTLNLGELTLQTIRRPEPGQTAPPLEFETLDGKRRRLADFRDKFVLLHLWRGASTASVLSLRKLRETFPNDQRLAIVEVGICDSPTTASLMDKMLDVESPRGFLDEESGRKAAKDFGLPPGVFAATTLLIAPDGQVIASGLSEDEIIPAVAKALGNPPD
ncbi:MAG: hypothetical protein JXQ73_23650, partial [Phycisphaerae bacterium]|nr:hypothetical protein [Phycisphaerae bacterium]